MYNQRCINLSSAVLILHYQLHLYRQSALVESAMYDLVNLLKNNLTAEQKVGLSAEEHYTCNNLDAKKQRCQECQPCSYYAMLNMVTQKNTEALVKCEYVLQVLRQAWQVLWQA